MAPSSTMSSRTTRCTTSPMSHARLYGAALLARYEGSWACAFWGVRPSYKASDEGLFVCHPPQHGSVLGGSQSGQAAAGAAQQGRGAFPFHLLHPGLGGLHPCHLLISSSTIALSYYKRRHCRRKPENAGASERGGLERSESEVPAHGSMVPAPRTRSRPTQPRSFRGLEGYRLARRAGGLPVSLFQSPIPPLSPVYLFLFPAPRVEVPATAVCGTSDEDEMIQEGLSAACRTSASFTCGIPEGPQARGQATCRGNLPRFFGEHLRAFSNCYRRCERNICAGWQGELRSLTSTVLNPTATAQRLILSAPSTAWTLMLWWTQ